LPPILRPALFRRWRRPVDRVSDRIAVPGRAPDFHETMNLTI
jgi:hypothetical protein